MNKNKKYHNFVPCIFGAHNFAVTSKERHGQYSFVEQECENCHRVQHKTLWHVQYEGTPAQSLRNSPRSMTKHHGAPVAHA